MKLAKIYKVKNKIYYNLGEIDIMAMWNAWRGCKKCSDGCLHCYIHKSDLKRKINTNEVVKTKDLIKQAKLSNIDFKSNG